MPSIPNSTVTRSLPLNTSRASLSVLQLSTSPRIARPSTALVDPPMRRAPTSPAPPLQREEPKNTALHAPQPPPAQPRIQALLPPPTGATPHTPSLSSTGQPAVRSAKNALP